MSEGETLRLRPHGKGRLQAHLQNAPSNKHNCFVSKASLELGQRILITLEREIARVVLRRFASAEEQATSSTAAPKSKAPSLVQHSATPDCSASASRPTSAATAPTATCPSTAPVVSFSEGTALYCASNVRPRSGVRICTRVFCMMAKHHDIP